MFQIKICGITNVDDALSAATAGADAIGLNFYRRSPRYVAPRCAAEIIAALSADVVKVGVFVDSPAGEICRLFDELPLDMIQLHGDQAPEFLSQLANRPTMRAFRVAPSDGRVGRAQRAPPSRDDSRTVGIAHHACLRPIADYLARCGELHAPLAMVLLDALVPGQYGGTGKTADWSAARAYAAADGLPPLGLAGGLTPENVAAAIRTVRPAAVDVAGGVEWQPGRKNPVAVAAFVNAARKAFDSA
jgi:phosphoribosylanthranilate isomerase